MIHCPKCGNNKKFAEIHMGGARRHEWTQEANGRFVFDGSSFDRVEDTFLKCGKCNLDISNLYRKFLQALFQPYSEEEHGV